MPSAMEIPSRVDSWHPRHTVLRGPFREPAYTVQILSNVFTRRNRSYSMQARADVLDKMTHTIVIGRKIVYSKRGKSHLASEYSLVA